MSDTYIVTAKTVEEAMAIANREYGGSGKDISYDILEMPKKGFLGIGAKDAKIKVTVSETEEINLGSLVAEMKSYKLQTAKYDDADEKPAKAKPENKPAPKADLKPKSKPEAKPAPKAEPKPETKPAPQAEPKAEVKPAPKAEPKPEAKPAPKAEPKAETKPVPKAEPKPEVKSVEKEENAPAESADKSVKIGVTQAEMDYALSFTNTLLANMQLGATAKAAPCPEGETYEIHGDANVYPAIEIEGDGTGILIGHHGETLDAIQYLLNLASIRRSGHGSGDYVKISLDIENYRSKREETLRALARRMAQRALKYKRNVFLEPMNAYERRIIHSELQGMENISTHSVGTDKNRKIIITYEGADKVPNDRNRRGRRNGKPENTEADMAVKEAGETVEKKEETSEEGSKPSGNRSRRNRHRNRNRSDRPAEEKQAAAEAVEKRPERPRPPKPQKLPIEALPAFLASVEDEPIEHLREN